MQIADRRAEDINVRLLFRSFCASVMIGKELRSVISAAEAGSSGMKTAAK